MPPSPDTDATQSIDSLTTGERIREIRESRRWSPSTLARACMLREEYLLQIESGEVVRVHTFTYRKIADALHVTLAQLLGEEEILAEQRIEDEIPENLRVIVMVTMRLLLCLGVLSALAASFFAVGWVFIHFNALWPFHRF